jgi:hypothetical protein
LDALESKADELEISITGHSNAEERLSRLATAGIDTNIHSSGNIDYTSFYVADGIEILLRVSNGKAAVVFRDEYFAKTMEMEYERICQEAEHIDNEA